MQVLLHAAINTFWSLNNLGTEKILRRIKMRIKLKRLIKDSNNFTTLPRTPVNAFGNKNLQTMKNACIKIWIK
jgi:hypothetical protein